MHIQESELNGNKLVTLRESYREGGKVKKRTLANLSSLPPTVVEGLKKALTKRPVDFEDETIKRVECVDTVPCGHVAAVLRCMDQIGLPGLIDAKESRERSIVLGLIAKRIIDPKSKYATLDLFLSESSLGRELKLKDVETEDVDKAVDWLFSKQSAIEEALMQRHLNSGDTSFISTSYKHPKRSILVDKDGHPISIVDLFKYPTESSDT
ncbi:MAG: hypothetical protein LBE27_02895, partial [Deltaproteobacteria bacterium]|nr:hypothetical protein [Deltaproteobacteria bacterium]